MPLSMSTLNWFLKRENHMESRSSLKMVIFLLLLCWCWQFKYCITNGLELNQLSNPFYFFGSFIPFVLSLLLFFFRSSSFLIPNIISLQLWHFHRTDLFCIYCCHIANGVIEIGCLSVMLALFMSTSMNSNIFLYRKTDSE